VNRLTHTPRQKMKTVSATTAATTAACFVLIALLSFLPFREKQLLHTKGPLHLWFHFAAFGTAAVLLGRHGRSMRHSLHLILTTIAFGLSIEMGEHLLFRGPLEWVDVLADSAAAILGALAVGIGRHFSPGENRVTGKADLISG
jgi:hypothetical protein